MKSYYHKYVKIISVFCCLELKNVLSLTITGIFILLPIFLTFNVILGTNQTHKNNSLNVFEAVIVPYVFVDFF